MAIYCCRQDYANNVTGVRKVVCVSVCPRVCVCVCMHVHVCVCLCEGAVLIAI